jgi:hypothetical protein
LALLQAEALACVAGLANVPNVRWHIFLGYQFVARFFLA